MNALINAPKDQSRKPLWCFSDRVLYMPAEDSTTLLSLLQSLRIVINVTFVKTVQTVVKSLVIVKKNRLSSFQPEDKSIDCH